jgi:hypothetical protein
MTQALCGRVSFRFERAFACLLRESRRLAIFGMSQKG